VVNSPLFAFKKFLFNSTFILLARDESSKPNNLLDVLVATLVEFKLVVDGMGGVETVFVDVVDV
jgi:hypothetical protein